LRAITPRMLTVISGLLSASAGIAWLIMFCVKPGKTAAAG